LELTGTELGKSAKAVAKDTAAQVGEKQTLPPHVDQIVSKNFNTRLSVKGRDIDVPAALAYFHVPKAPVEN